MKPDSTIPPPAAQAVSSVETRGPEGAEAPRPEDGEFRLTIKKLEMPVRPRGVLAE